MPDRDRNAGLAKLLHDIAIGHVGPLNAVAKLMHDLGDARHADAANADEMDRPDIGAHRLHHAGTAVPGAPALTRGKSPEPTAVGATPLPTRSTRSARSRAA